MLAQVVLALGVSLLVAFAGLGVAGWRMGRRYGIGRADAAGVALHLVRLCAALARDPRLPRRQRWQLRAALLYSCQPFNLIPDFIPVIGYVDNVIVLGWALRNALRHAGTGLLAERWTGPPKLLDRLYAMLGATAQPATAARPATSPGNCDAA